MERGELRLNDFEGFERYLFTDEESALPSKEKWRKYYGNCRFYPPLNASDIQTVAEAQLCHYAYWMAISAFSLNHKPEIYIENLLENRVVAECYACHVRHYMISNDSLDTCSFGCPVKNWESGPFNHCMEQGSLYDLWWKKKSDILAAKIAHLEWRDPNEALGSVTDDSSIS